MYSYFAFLHSGVEAYTGRALEDGKRLACHCIEQLKELDDPDQFPPRLLILLTSPAYLELPKARGLLNGINQTFTEAGYEDVPLIGCSTAAVFFNQHVHHNGALLICLASRLLRIKVAIGDNTFNNPDNAVDELLDRLELRSPGNENPNPFDNRQLITFLPGFNQKRYLASGLHKRLRENLHAQIPIFGGVATADSVDRIKPGIVFANREVHRDAVVAARVMCGTPISVSLSHGLDVTSQLLRVGRFSKEKNEIYTFFERTDVAGVMRDLEERNGIPLLAEIAVNRHPVIDNPQLTESGQAIHLIRNISEDTVFRAMRPDPEKILESVLLSVEHAKKRVRAENPVACLALKCNGLLHNRQKIALDFEQEFAAVERNLNNHHGGDYVGAFVDGEAGVDRDGRSLLRNWSTAAMVFGDELSDRTPVYRGFAKLAELSRQASAPKLQTSTDRLLKLIYDIGYPGAMISFVLHDQEGDTVVAQAAIGPRYQKIKDLTRRKLSSNDVLAVVAQKKKPRFVRDSRTDPTCDNLAVRNSGIISQYVIPMETLDGLINAVLQIDLGDASYKPDLHATEQEVLDALGTIVSSNLNRIFNWEQSKIMRKLDRAFKESLPAATIEDGLQKYLEAVVKAFDLEMGHIRIEHPDKNRLVLVAGTGHYYEVARQHRKEIDIGDWSPTAQSFRDERHIGVNDAANNKMHQEMSRRLANDPSLRTELEKVGSYANLPFNSEHGKRGTISLVSRDAWFFNWFHERTFPALAERASFLVEHLRRKQDEEEARRHLQFLLDVSPNLNTISPSQTDQVLKDVTKRFAEAVNAEVASLYLFDTALNIYVLQAEYNWQNKDLVGQANYSKDDGWIGVRALKEKPRLIPNLCHYYREQSYPKSNRYDRAMFGQPLSETFTVEVIGVPLKVRKETIGVLALYRDIREGQPSGFATIAPDVLQEGANNLASLVSALLSEKNRQALQAKISIVAQSSHEFKRLLRNLKSMPSKLKAAMDQSDKAELEAEIRDLSERIKKAEESINRRLKLAETAREINLQIRRLSMSIKKVAKNITEELIQDKAKSKTTIDSEEFQDLMVKMDWRLTEEAFHNIIGNAIKFMPKGGEVKISARPDIEKGIAIVTIADNGLGMSREKLASVKRCLSGEGKGTGWGLIIASGLISLQGGTIDIESEKGVGTTVTVTLSLSPKEG